MRIGVKRLLAALRWRRDFATERLRNEPEMRQYWSGYLQAVGSLESFLQGCQEERPRRKTVRE